MKSHLFTLLTATLLALSLTVKGAHAATLPGMDDPEARGLAIATMSDETNLGYGDKDRIAHGADQCQWTGE